MRSIKESIIGRKGNIQYRSIIIVPFGSDLTTYVNHPMIGQVFRFGTGRSNWTGFVIPYNNPGLAELAKNKLTRVFISPMEENKFIKEFGEVNSHLTATMIMNDPDSSIKAPEYALKIYPDELKNYIK